MQYGKSSKIYRWQHNYHFRREVFSIGSIERLNVSEPTHHIDMVRK